MIETDFMRGRSFPNGEEKYLAITEKRHQVASEIDRTLQLLASRQQTGMQLIMVEKPAQGFSRHRTMKGAWAIGSYRRILGGQEINDTIYLLTDGRIQKGRPQRVEELNDDDLESVLEGLRHLRAGLGY